MSTNIIEEPLSTSYEFCDEKELIIVTLYAHGAFEISAIDFSLESDSLEVRTSAGEHWKFQLWAHTFSDRAEVDTQINSAKTQTAIEIRLYKQTRKPWPQLHSKTSTPITPQRDDQFDQYQTVNMMDSQLYELQIKKLHTDFSETSQTFTTYIYLKKVKIIEINFTETNFTVIFTTNNEDFLNQHLITSDTNIKLLVRVKERIIPNQCKHKLTPTCIEIILAKENSNSRNWGRLEPSEYSETRPLIQHTTNINSNKAIPLPPPLPPAPPTVQPLDKFPSASSFESSIQQRGNSMMSKSSSSITSVGFTGIYNPANSCFMNAAVQCLSNTRELRDYFIENPGLPELNRINPLGMKGAMAEEFSNIINHLWSGKHNWINANRLRAYAAQRHQEFVGHGQHDAQELLTIILDAVHEDLNRVLTKPQVPPIDDNARPDHIVADEYWRGYLSRNDSIIVQLFTGQFKSKTKCPQCHKESITFDPFTSISVPLPKRTAIDTIVTYRNDDKPSIKYRIIMSADGSILEFKRLLSVKCGLSTNKMIVYKIRTNRNIDTFKDDDRVSSLGYSWNSNDIVFVTETLISAECNNEPIVNLMFIQRIFKVNDFITKCDYCKASQNPFSPQIFCQNCFKAAYCDENCQKFHYSSHKSVCGHRSSENYEIIGNPFIISLPQSKLTCENVFEQISVYAKRNVDIHIEHSKRIRQSLGQTNHYDLVENEDTFSDVENVDWLTIKNILSSSDPWSICRLGDYFVKSGKNKRRRHYKKFTRKEKILKNNNHDEKSTSNINENNNSTDEFDMIDDIYGSQRLFRLMPQMRNNLNSNAQPIVESGDEADKILHRHTMFSIDWFTDNKIDAPLHVVPSKNRHGVNNLIEDESVSDFSFGDQELTLQQCLQMFIEPEILGPDDKWFCPSCKEHIQAEKKMSIWRLPPILIIHLKRFKYHHGSAFGYLSDSRVKIDTPVKFPIHDLNMDPYCSSTNDSKQSRYDLFGIINHRGSAWFGHYTSYARLLSYNDSAKTEIGWRNFDDEHVSSLPHDKEMTRSDAYVLFYRHRHLSVDFIPMQQNSSVNSTNNCETTSSVFMDTSESKSPIWMDLGGNQSSQESKLQDAIDLMS